MPLTTVEERCTYYNCKTALYTNDKSNECDTCFEKNDVWKDFSNKILSYNFISKETFTTIKLENVKEETPFIKVEIDSQKMCIPNCKLNYVSDYFDQKCAFASCGHWIDTVLFWENSSKEMDLFGKESS